MVPPFYLDPAVQLKVLLQAWGKHCITSVVQGSQLGWRLGFGLSPTLDTSLLHQLTCFDLRTWLPAVYLCNVVGSALWWTWLYQAGHTPWRAASSLRQSESGMSHVHSTWQLPLLASWKALRTRMSLLCLAGVTRPVGSYSPDTWLKSSLCVRVWARNCSCNRSWPSIFFFIFKQLKPTITWSLSYSIT